MKTRILRAISPEDIAIAGEIIRRGGLVAFPTETVYGLGANAFSDAAVAKIYSAKGRQRDNPLIAHITDISAVDILAEEYNAATKALLTAFWPGALTLLFKRKAGVCEAAACGLKTIAVRSPSNNAARDIINAAGVPIAAPSANISGRPSPTRFAHVLSDLDGVIDAIVDGGDCAYGVESTVLDVTGDMPVLLRPGCVTRNTIEAALRRPLAKPGDANRPLAPGMKYRHYAPNAQVVILRENTHIAGKNPVVLAGGKTAAGYIALGFCVIDMGINAQTAASRLFAALREADELGADIIYAQPFEEDGFGEAYMNRLTKAAETGS